MDCYLLGDAYRNGKSEWNVPKDEKRARELFAKGCPDGTNDGSVECREVSILPLMDRVEKLKNDRRPCELPTSARNAAMRGADGGK